MAGADDSKEGTGPSWKALSNVKKKKKKKKGERAEDDLEYSHLSNDNNNIKFLLNN